MGFKLFMFVCLFVFGFGFVLLFVFFVYFLWKVFECIIKNVILNAFKAITIQLVQLKFKEDIIMLYIQFEDIYVSLYFRSPLVNSIILTDFKLLYTE